MIPNIGLLKRIIKNDYLLAFHSINVLYSLGLIITFLLYFVMFVFLKLVMEKD